MEYFLTWLVFRMNGIHDIIETFLAILICVVIIIFFFSAILARNRADNDPNTRFDTEFFLIMKKFKIKLMTIIILLLFSADALLPTTKQAVGIILIPKILTNDHIQNISENTLRIIEKFTDTKLKELILNELQLGTNSTVVNN